VCTLRVDSCAGRQSLCSLLLQFVAVCCSVFLLSLQCVAVCGLARADSRMKKSLCCSVSQCVAVGCYVGKVPSFCVDVAVCCSVLQCVAVCRSVLLRWESALFRVLLASLLTTGANVEKRSRIHPSTSV